MMSRKLNIRKKAAALVVASVMMWSTAASAIAVPPFPRDPVCDQQKANECVSMWQSLGYGNYAHCVAHRQCAECPPWWGYMCGIGPNYATEPVRGTKPW